MSKSVFAICAALLCAPFNAVAAPPPANTAPASVPPQNVISAITGDFNDDGSFDRAVLVDNGDDATANLIVYFYTDNGFSLGGFSQSIVYNGGMAGSIPDLRLGKTGGLQVHSENIAVGRDHWEQTLSIAWRNKQLVVSGITATHNDTLDPNAGGGCDVNLLSGKGKTTAVVRGKNITKALAVAAGGVPLGQWNDDRMPKACQ